MKIAVCIGSVLLGAVTSFGSIIVDGVDQGDSYTLNNNVGKIIVNGGTLTIGRNAGIGTLLELNDGYVVANLLSSGNLNGDIAISGGHFLAEGRSVSYGRGFSMTGGLLNMEFASSINGDIILNGNARLLMHETVDNINGKVEVWDQGVAYYGPGYITTSDTDENGKVIGSDDPISGQVNLRGQLKDFSVSQSASLYVGVIPEPAVAGLLVVAGIGIIAGRRIFG